MFFNDAIQLLDAALLCEAEKEQDINKLLLNCAWEIVKKQMGINKSTKKKDVYLVTAGEHKEGLEAIFSAILHEVKTVAEAKPYNKQKSVTFDEVKMILNHRLAIETE